LTEDNEKFVDP